MSISTMFNDSTLDPVNNRSVDGNGATVHSLFVNELHDTIESAALERVDGDLEPSSKVEKVELARSTAEEEELAILPALSIVDQKAPLEKSHIADSKFFIDHIDELNHFWTGRSDENIAKVLRMKLATMTSEQIRDTDKALQKNGHLPLDELLKHQELPRSTKDALVIYSKGVENLTDTDYRALIESAIEHQDKELFSEAISSGSDELRKEYSTDTELERVKSALEFGSSEITEIYINLGTTNAASIVDEHSTWFGDNEEGIESTLLNMPEKERELYRLGRKLSFNNQQGDSEESQLALQVYENTFAQLESAGNSIELIKWEDQILNKGGSLVTKLAKHSGFWGSDSKAEVLTTLESASEAEKLRFANDDDFRQLVVDMLGELLNPMEMGSAIEIMDSPEQKRDILTALKDVQEAPSTAVSAIKLMSDSERRAYLSDEKYRQTIDDALDRVLVTDSLESKIAKRTLSGVDASDPLLWLWENQLSETENAAQVALMVENLLQDNPDLHHKLKSPNNKREEEFAFEFRSAMGALVGGPNTTALIENGRLPIVEKVSLAKNDSSVSMITVAASASKSEVEYLLKDEGFNSIGNVLDDQSLDVLKQVWTKGGADLEDYLRGYVVSAGVDIEQVILILRRSSAEVQRKVEVAYNEKYGSELYEDLKEAVPQDQWSKVEAFYNPGARSPEQLFNKMLRSYSQSRDGAGSALVDSIWDGTGMEADKAMNQYFDTVRNASRDGSALSEFDHKQEIGRVADSIERFKNSKEAMAETTANLVITGAAIAATPLTAGASLSLAAKIGIAGVAGSGIKVLTKSQLQGNDYDWSLGQLSYDTASGFVHAGLMAIGPAEIGSLAGIAESTAVESGNFAGKMISVYVPPALAGGISGGSMGVVEGVNSWERGDDFGEKLSKVLKEAGTQAALGAGAAVAFTAVAQGVAWAAKGSQKVPGKESNSVARTKARSAVDDVAAAGQSKPKIEFDIPEDKLPGLSEARVNQTFDDISGQVDQTKQFWKAPTESKVARMKNGDWQIRDQYGRSKYLTDTQFRALYSPVKERGNFYIDNPTLVEAAQLTEAVEIATPRGGRIGQAGDWIVAGPHGERYIVPDKHFDRIFSTAEDGAIPDWLSSKKSWTMNTAKNEVRLSIEAAQAGDDVGAAFHRMKARKIHQSAQMTSVDKNVTPYAVQDMADMYTEAGHIKEATRLLGGLGDEHALSKAKVHHALAQEKAGLLDEAERYLKESEDLKALAKFYERQNRLADAERANIAYIEKLNGDFKPNDGAVTLAENNLTDFYARHGMYDKAEDSIRNAMEKRSKFGRKAARKSAIKDSMRMGYLHDAKGNTKEADEWFFKALDHLEDGNPNPNPELVKKIEDLEVWLMERFLRNKTPERLEELLMRGLDPDSNALTLVKAEALQLQDKFSGAKRLIKDYMKDIAPLAKGKNVGLDSRQVRLEMRAGLDMLREVIEAESGWGADKALLQVDTVIKSIKVLDESMAGVESVELAREKITNGLQELFGRSIVPG